jgi:hypothetical protein
MHNTTIPGSPAHPNRHRAGVRALVPALLGVILSVCAAAPQNTMPNPDFTKGGKIPAGANHDWNLGATGARGWIYSHKLETTEARQIAVTKVDKGSPADGVLEIGDVILGVSGKPFSSDPRVAFGRALTAAEAAAGNLTLTRWRDGKTQDVVVKLPVLGSYSVTAPYHCPKSKLVFEQGCEALAERMREASYVKKQNPITRSLNALALLASGEKKYLPLVKNEAQWASGYSASAMQTWWYAYVIMLLSEYEIATGDDSFQPGLERLALEAAKGQSIVGSWGHKFAGPDGRLVGYGMMNAPGVPLTISLLLAREAGVRDPALDLAIERSARLLRFYIGKGAVPYGDHHPWTQTHEDNGKCGMAGVMFNFLGEENGAEFFSRMSLASHGPERDCGHTGNFTNMLWAMPGVALAGPHATGAWMKEFGAWYYDLARTWDGAFPHQGPPDMKKDKFGGWDATGAYLLAYAMPLKKILLTGKQPHIAPQVDAATANNLILDGRGWSNNNRYRAYDSLNPDQLLDRLGSWSPAVRERAAIAIQRRQGEKPLAALVKMLDAPELEARYGACEALILLKGAAAPAVPQLTALLDHDDLWLRVKAAEALAHIGRPAMGTLPVLLERLTIGPTQSDPRGMEQRYLCFSVFGVMLKNSLDGVDRDLLGKAVTAGLQNQDGRARGNIANIYQQLGYDEIRPLLPAIHRAIVEPSPSGIMFADGIRLSGLELLARHRIREGMELCLDIMDLDRWGRKNRVERCLKILATYGGAAKPLLPRLHQLEKDLGGPPDAKGGNPLAVQLAGLIRNIESATDAPTLIHLPR